MCKYDPYIQHGVCECVCNDRNSASSTNYYKACTEILTDEKLIKTREKTIIVYMGMHDFL